MRNAIAGLILALTFVGGFVFIARHASADAALPPSSMTQLDAARLHAAIAELNALSAAEVPHRRVVREIFERYRIDAADVDAKRIGFDFETGAIFRASPAVAQTTKVSK